jgi:AcrR family transcriptional regulator
MAESTESTADKPSELGVTAQRVRDEAARLFWQKGYAATSTRQLADAIGIQKASLYHHIGSKEELLYQLCVDSLERMEEGVRAALDTTDDPVERLNALVRTHLTFLLDDRDKHAAMLTEMRFLSAEYRGRVLALRSSYEQMMRDVLQAAQDAGKLRSDISAGMLSLGLFDLLNWSIFWYEPDRSPAPTDLAESFLTLFLEGAANRTGS